MPQNPVDTEAATIASYWLAIVSFGLGLVGIGFTIYTFFSASPSALLVAGSGWLAAIMVSVVAWITTVRLLRYVKGREEELRRAVETCAQNVLEAKLETQSIKAEHERLLSISEYLVTKTVRKATKRVVPAPIDADGENAGDDQV